MQETVSPCLTRPSESRLACSHESGPIVPGAKTKRFLGEHRRDGDAGQVVVGERRVADVRGDHDLVLDLALQPRLGEREVAGAQRRVDHDLVVARLERLQRIVREAEAPRARVVGRPVRDQAGLVGQREQALAQLLERHRGADRLAAVDDVQRGVREVDHAPAVRAGDMRLADVPLVRDRPVEHLGAGRQLGARERDVLGDDVERRPHTVAGKAAAEREQTLHQPVRVLPDAQPSTSLRE
jgi:hypothetical protein